MESSEKKSSKEIIAEYPAIAEIVQGDEEIAYLEGIGKQHFKSEKDAKTSTGIGSCIYEESCGSPFEALELIADKIGKDDAPDREKLIKKGASPSAFTGFLKYYMLEGIKGKSRVINADRLPSDTKVKLVMSAKGLPSLVVKESEVPQEALADVDYGTVIIGPAKRKKMVDGKEVEEVGSTTWTMHAGYPMPFLTNQLDDENDVNSTQTKDENGKFRLADSFGWKYGNEFTAAEVIKKFGEMAEATKNHPNPRMRVNKDVCVSII